MDLHLRFKTLYRQPEIYVNEAISGNSLGMKMFLVVSGGFVESTQELRLIKRHSFVNIF